MSANKNSLLMATTFLLFLLLNACSSPKDPSKENFKKAIGGYFNEARSCTAHKFEFPNFLFDSDQNDNKTSYEYRKDRLDFLTSLGFLEATKQNVEQPGAIVAFRQVKPATVYKLTQKGKENSEAIYPQDESSKMLARTQALSGENTTNRGFCYAKGREVEAVDFRDATGEKVVKVSFVYKDIQVSDWVEKDPNKKSYMSDGKHFATTTLELGNEGWRVNENATKN